MLKRASYSGSGCCVVGCHNSYANTSKNVKFYAFPGRPHEQKRREAWITKIRRCGNGRETWEPSKYSKICSEHFVGNHKSNHPLNPAYCPSIFPKQYRVIEENSNQKKKRFDRYQERLQKQKRHVIVAGNMETMENTTSTEIQEDHYHSKSCQASLSNPSLEDNTFNFICVFEKSDNSVSCQANISSNNPNRFTQYEDKNVGNDEELQCDGFHGFVSFKDDSEISSLCGVSMNVFALLLSLIHVAHGNDKLCIKDKLVLFLMKMKLGLSYRALSVLFRVHYTTASRIFLSLLTELTEVTQSFVRWPSRTVIDATMPKSFKLNYPKCRAIIDCTEVKVSQPHSIEKRIYLYSRYKSNYTTKFLIAIAPNGFISFVSKCYGGRSSDSYITNDCGILNLFEPNDVILADKGFPGIYCTNNVLIVMPPIVHDGHLSIEEIEQTYTIASVRVHVERSIQRLKIYRILKSISLDLFPHIDKIVRMCCVLTNLQPPTINEH